MSYAYHQESGFRWGDGNKILHCCMGFNRHTHKVGDASLLGLLLARRLQYAAHDLWGS